MEHLTEEQRIESAQRLVSDADLIRDGASINTLGSLVITADQYDSLSCIDYNVEHKWAWLSTNLDEVFSQSSVPQMSWAKVANPLKREGIESRLDILIAGKYRVEDIPMIGSKAVSQIVQILQNNHGFIWLDRPQITDIVALGADLNQVNASALGKRAIRVYYEEPVQNQYSKCVSIQDVLDVGKGEYNSLANTREHTRDRVIQEIMKCYQAALEFSGNFHSAKAML